ASRPGEAGQRQPFEQPLEASFRAPCRVADESQLLRPCLLDPLAVSPQRTVPVRRVVRGARAERNPLETVELLAGGKQRRADARKRVLAGKRREVGNQE